MEDYTTFYIYKSYVKKLTDGQRTGVDLKFQVFTPLKTDKTNDCMQFVVIVTNSVSFRDFFINPNDLLPTLIRYFFLISSTSFSSLIRFCPCSCRVSVSCHDFSIGFNIGNDSRQSVVDQSVNENSILRSVGSFLPTTGVLINTVSWMIDDL